MDVARLFCGVAAAALLGACGKGVEADIHTVKEIHTPETEGTCRINGDQVEFVDHTDGGNKVAARAGKPSVGEASHIFYTDDGKPAGLVMAFKDGKCLVYDPFYKKGPVQFFVNKTPLTPTITSAP